MKKNDGEPKNLRKQTRFTQISEVSFWREGLLGAGGEAGNAQPRSALGVKKSQDAPCRAGAYSANSPAFLISG